MHRDFKLLSKNKMTLVLPRNFQYDFFYDTGAPFEDDFMGRVLFTAGPNTITIQEFSLVRSRFDDYLASLGITNPLSASFDLKLGPPPFVVSLTFSIASQFQVSKTNYELKSSQIFYGPTSTANVETTLGLFNLGNSTLYITESVAPFNYTTLTSQILLPPNFPDSTTEVSINWIVFTIFAIVFASILVYSYFPSVSGPVKILRHHE